MEIPRTRYATTREGVCLVEATGRLGLAVRAGVHTGEVQLVDGKFGGLAVNIGARVGAAAAPSEILVSQTVKDLTAGSGLDLEGAGEYELKGVPDRWRLYRVIASWGARTLTAWRARSSRCVRPA